MVLVALVLSDPSRSIRIGGAKKCHGDTEVGLEIKDRNGKDQRQ